MKRFLLSFLIIILFCSPCLGNKLDDRQLKETYAKSADVYTKAEANATIEAAIAAIPAPSVNQTVTVAAAENLTEGNVVSLINDGGTWKAKRTDNTNVAGVAMSTVTTGNNVVVTLKGTVANQSGLTTGALYYRKADYTISVTPELINGAYIFVGYAKSATELVLD